MPALPLDPAALTVFLFATFAAALVAGLAGFAFGVTAAAIWLYVLTPAQSAVLIAAYAVMIQSYSTWKLRHAVRPARIWPYLLGGALGVPLGAEILRGVPADPLRAGIGALVVLYCVYAFARPRWSVGEWGGRWADGGAGLLGGVLGPSAGLGALPPVIWRTARGGPKDEQKATFQPVAVGIFLMVLAWLGGVGQIESETVALFAIGIPAAWAGNVLGHKWYGRIGETDFRRVVLGLLLVSGVVLMAR